MSERPEENKLIYVVYNYNDLSRCKCYQDREGFFILDFINDDASSERWDFLTDDLKGWLYADTLEFEVNND